jgi:hypothetical protein
MTQPNEEQYVPNQAIDDNAIPMPERVPWSEIAQEFASVWGRADPKDPQPEHMEVLGINGAGKTLFTCKAVQERVAIRRTPVVFLQSKPADETVMRLGWPLITNGDIKQVQKERQSIFWPQTNATGRARKLYQAEHFRNLLNSLWHPNSNVIVVYDDFGYIQELVCQDGEQLAPIVQMFLREGRSSGITNVLVKQRAQGSRREMHSETQWKVGFATLDQDDQERVAEIFGNRRGYLPIVRSMDADKHEFLLKHSRTGSEVISWIDTPLRPLARPNPKQQPRP